MICLNVSSDILRCSVLPNPLDRSVVCLGLVEIPLLSTVVVVFGLADAAPNEEEATPSGTVKGRKLL